MSKTANGFAQLLQHRPLKPSFVPDIGLRDLRELSRDRTSLVAERSRLKNRIQKILEDANIKLGSVASDVFGSARTPVPVQMQDGRGRQAPSSLFRAVPEDRRVTFCRPGWRSELLTLGSGSRLLSASTSTRAEDSDEVLLPEIERQQKSGEGSCVSC